MGLSLKGNVKLLSKILIFYSENFLAVSKKKTNSVLSSYLYFQKVVNQAGPAASASYGLIASIFLFIFGGFYIDNYLDTSPVATVIGMVLGLVVGFYQIVKFAKYKRK